MIILYVALDCSSSVVPLPCSQFCINALLTFKGGDGDSGAPEALLPSLQPCLLCPSVLLCKVGSEPG